MAGRRRVFCKKIFTETLFDDHQKCRNWWTSSNQDLPLVRYTGCSIKLYQCEKLDYIVKYQTVLPMNSNKLTYPSCQPWMMQMSKGKIVVPSKLTEHRKKPYKLLKISPPSQFTTKWYFQSDIVKTPLLVLHTSATSLQNPFIKPNTLNNNLTFTTLNTKLIQNREMGIPTENSWPFKKLGTYNEYFYILREENLTDPNNVQIQHIIALTQLQTDSPGYAFSDRSHITERNITEYFKNFKNYWGNIFNKHNLQEQDMLCYSTVSPEALASAVTTNSAVSPSTTWKDLGLISNRVITKLDDKIFIDLQYSPDKDTGHDTQIYLLSNKTGHGWDPQQI